MPEILDTPGLHPIPAKVTTELLAWLAELAALTGTDIATVVYLLLLDRYAQDAFDVAALVICTGLDELEARDQLGPRAGETA